MKYIMAIDEGTTGIRAVIVDNDGNIISKAYEEISQIFPHTGWHEQDAEEIWRKCIIVIKKALNEGKIKASEIEAIGITTQRATNLLWDEKTGKPVYNAITWHDTRTAEVCRERDNIFKIKAMRGVGSLVKSASKIFKGIRRTKSGALLITASSLSFSPASSLAHTYWILNEVEKAKKAENLLFGTIDTWLLWKLTGGKVHATDYSNASATGMFNPFSLKWNNLFLETFNIPYDILPEVRETSGDFGVIDKKILGVEIPVMGVIADQQSALFAEGCFNAGEVKCTHGTGSFIDMNIGNKLYGSIHKLLPFIAWRINGKTNYMLEGMMNTSGAAIQWLRDNLGVIDELEDSEKLALSVDDTGGVYFVPAFTGLSSPYWDPHACAIAVGLSRKTKKEHIVRAVLEGIVYRCRDILLAMEEDTRLKISSIKVDGGASKNNFLLQFMADMLNVKVERPKILDVTALGSAYIAGIASGYWQMEEIAEKRKIDRVFEPRISEEKRRALYEGWRRAIERAKRWKRWNGQTQ